MFLRKLMVILVPTLLLVLVCAALPALNNLGFASNVLKGCLIGVALALLLPLSGATRRKEPFAILLWAPTAAAFLVVLYQYLSVCGIKVPVLEVLATTDAQIVLTECIFGSFMLVTCLRTHR